MDRPIGHAWGKLERDDRGDVVGWHSLVDHSADVAACVEALLAVPTIAARFAHLAGCTSLPSVWVSRLAACAFLHDLGKANSGFQARWSKNAPFVGHMGPALVLLCAVGLNKLRDRALPITAMERWGAALSEAINAVLAHHGAPLNDGPVGLGADLGQWQAVSSYDPETELANLSLHVQQWFAPAFESGGPLLPETPMFWHAFAGLAMLADWLGSDQRAFPFANGVGDNRIAFARRRATKVVAEVGLDARAFSALLPSPVEFSSVSTFRPTPAQAATAASDASIVVLEAETGSGKTEAALWRFARLLADGRVQGLYFALPTRVAATSLFERVRISVARMFPDPQRRPAVVLAVPGYARVDEAVGRALPGFEVQWDDDPDDLLRRQRWAAESPKRFLAATVAVGTIDQALLGTIPVKHAHMRAASLLRSLLVVDEVHASDAYMEALLRNLLALHRAAGGEVVLLSATLGVAARSRLLTGKLHPEVAPLAEAEAVPYPAVWSLTDRGPEALAVQASGATKAVSMQPLPIIGDPNEIAVHALALARSGAKVLVVRNTVRDAVATAQAMHRLAPDDRVLFRCVGVPTLHHGRFAREDRALLDAAVEESMGRRDQRSRGGLVLIGTQTLEQSLDIDADAMLTDMCPADVLLQRLGRLQRHERPRPVGFQSPTCCILVPPEQTDLATWRGHGIGGELSPYPGRPVIAATRRLIAEHPRWDIPRMNRMLVERSTHPDMLEELVRAEGTKWQKPVDEYLGRNLAKSVHGTLAGLDWRTPFSRLRFPTDEPAATRLGAKDLLVLFPSEGLIGPFGSKVTALTIPPYLLGREVDPTKLEATDFLRFEGGFRFRVSTVEFEYCAYGLLRC